MRAGRVFMPVIAALVAGAGVVLLAQTATSTAAIPKADAKDWIQLFNGKDLTGWTPKFAKHDLGENYNDTFRVEEGLLKVRYDKWETFNEEFGHMFYKDPFSYYVIAAEYRFVGDQVKGGPAWAIRNNGLMLHSPDPKTMMKDQDFPISIEVQLLGGFGKPRTTANLCTPGTNVVMDGKLETRHCINSKSKTYEGDQWVRVEVLPLRRRGAGPRIYEAADRRRQREPGRPEGQGRRHPAHRRLHLDPGRDGANRFPEDRGPES